MRTIFKPIVKTCVRYDFDMSVYEGGLIISRPYIEIIGDGKCI